MRILFFITKPYSVPILSPIESYCSSIDQIEVAWFKAGSAKSLDLEGKVIETTHEVLSFNPDAVIVPGNVVPDFWPGIKVQIFHGLCEEKKGHYDITGFFDLYCTPGPQMTEKFMELGEQYNTFLVRETGWPKLDLLLPIPNADEKKFTLGVNPDKKLILYAPTFSPKYTSADDLFSSIQESQLLGHEWVVKFHDLEKNATVERYRTLNSNLFKIIENKDILPWMTAADLLITDTSSVAYEFLLLDRPVITYQASARLEKGIDITEPEHLIGAITRSIEDPGEYTESRKDVLSDIHPYSDGQSSQRLIGTIDNILQNDELDRLQPKPRNWIRKKQIRKIVSP